MDKTKARALVRKIDAGDLTSERGFIHRFPFKPLYIAFFLLSYHNR